MFWKNCIVFAFAFLVFDVAASKPKAIDCKKASSIERGMEERQVKRILGKPYSMNFSRGGMSYGWVSPSGEDKLEVHFDVLSRKVNDRRVVAVMGMCGGKVVIDLTPGAIAVASIHELSRHSDEMSLPKRVTFDGDEFHLAYVKNSRKFNHRFVEYLPEGQSLKRWANMLGVHFHLDDSTPGQKHSQVKEIAKRTGNHYFRDIHVADDGSEVIVALPFLLEDHVEYQVTRWILRDGITRGYVHSSRHYFSGDEDLHAFVEREEGFVGQRAEELRQLEQIVPPDLGRTESLTISVDGTEDGPVWIQVPARGMISDEI